MALGTAMFSGGLGIQDGVGWVLEHPEVLYVQVELDEATSEAPQNAVDEASQEVALWVEEQLAVLEQSAAALLGLTLEEEEGEKKPNLAVVAQGGPSVGPLMLRDWGFVVGQKFGREPIVLPTSGEATWEQASEAQRTRQHSIFQLALGAVLMFLLMGLRRLPDLWTRTPHERAYYWPGRQSQKGQEDLDPEGVESKGGE